jgi:hypothetical protein
MPSEVPRKPKSRRWVNKGNKKRKGQRVMLRPFAFPLPSTSVSSSFHTFPPENSLHDTGPSVQDPYLAHALSLNRSEDG